MRITRALREQIYQATATTPNAPDAEVVMDWMERGISLAVDGCELNLREEECDDGQPSWVYELGLIEPGK